MLLNPIVIGWVEYRMPEHQQKQQHTQQSHSTQTDAPPVPQYKSYSEKGVIDVHGETSFTPLCNFYMKLDNITEIDDTKLLDGEFLITSDTILPFDFKEENKAYFVKKIFTSIDNTALYSDKEFVNLMKAYPEMWHKQGKVKSLRTEITKEISMLVLGNVVKKTRKVQDFGWNNDFTAFLTPKKDLVLQMLESEDPDGGKGYSPHFIYDYGEYEIKYSDGSVHVLNDKISKKIRLGLKFDSKDEVTRLLIHINDIFLKLHPKMRRIIPIVFLSPLKTPLLRIGKSYQQYIQGMSGYGKTQLCYLLMSFFSDIQSPEDLVSITGRTTTGAIKELGYYHKDCLFVIDNFKESILGNKKDDFISMLQSIADNQSDLRMTESKFSSFNVRGTTLVTGEEMVMDAATIRKFDVIRFDTKIDLDIRKLCEPEKSNYPIIIEALIEFLLKKYSNGIVSELERRIRSYESIFQDPLFLLNQIGYDLFLELMLYYGVVTEEERLSMQEVHLTMLRAEEIEKLQSVEERTSAQIYIDTIRDSVTGKYFSIIRDPEYDIQHKPVIGQTNKECTEITIYGESYATLRGFLKDTYNLPRDKDSVYTQLEEMIKKGEIEASFKKVHIAGTSNTKLTELTFKREFLLPRSNIVGDPKLSEMAKMIGIVVNNLKIDSQPTVKQYNELLNEMVKFLPNHTKNRKTKFINDIDPMVVSYFDARGWVTP